MSFVGTRTVTTTYLHHLHHHGHTNINTETTVTQYSWWYRPRDDIWATDILYRRLIKNNAVLCLPGLKVPRYCNSDEGLGDKRTMSN